MRALIIFSAAVMLAATAGAHAQSNEDRLRDALRQSVTEMRAAQDQAAQAQADAQKAVAERAALQTALDAAQAKLAEAAAKPAAPAADVARLQAENAAARSQIAALQQALTAAQHAYQGQAQQAVGLDAEAKHLQAGLKSQSGALETCKTENARLMQTAESILHLYQTQDFRGLLLRSYEPFIGAAKVKLENLVQDYDDKIHDQEYVPASPHR